ncbi:DUF2541 domain-containing protein [Limibacter armeniacum]|uniref:DUF2541 domain-containing protein n=1 Tax=Limibacter armeniacum TaxID=466084 RepID=UPI002FE5C5F5
MKTKLLVIGILLLFITTRAAYSQDKEDGWIKIATKTVNFQSETDEVKPSSGEADVSKIKIKCIQGTVKIKDITIEMDDGKDSSPTVVGVLTKGQSSRVIDLPGKDNKLKKVKFKYDSMGKVVISKRAKVEIWGKKR